MSRTSPKQEYPITVIGNGITGLSTAWHLQARGLGPCRVLSAGADARPSYHSPGYLLGGTWSNFTRHCHSYGTETASCLWRFGNAAFDALLAYCHQQRLPVQQGRRVRLLTSLAELTEAQIAVAQLGQEGFTSRLLEPGSFAGLGPRVLGLQDDGERGAWLDSLRLLRHLQGALSQPVDERRLLAWEPAKGGGLRLRLADGASLRTELLVLACHDSIRGFLPQLQDALIPVADQWAPCRWQRLSAAGGDWLKPGLVFTAHHGYEWGVTTGKGLFAAGGCRYLRKLAGVGEEAPAFLPHVQERVVANLQRTLAWGEGLSYEPRQAVAFSDIIPCDELPLIGPLFGSERILLATGYMGLGLSLGFFAGACLAELISTGQCPSLPRQFWPERLRSL